MRLKHLVDPYPPEEVTGRSPEVPAADVGLRRADVEAIWSAVVHLYRVGLHPAIALCVRHRGQVILDRSIGHARGNEPRAARGAPKVLATPDTLFSLFSASKAVTAILIHLLDDRGLVHLDDAVVEYIPEFASHRKQWITLRHVLTHRAGLPNTPADKLDLDLLLQPDAINELMCAAKPVSRPGHRLAYHAITGGFILGEIVRRVTGGTVRDLLRKEICEPLGLSQFNYGVPASRLSEVAPHVCTGLPPFPPFATLMRSSLGMDFRAAVELSNDPRFLTGIVPSANVISTANEVSGFFELLLREGELDGVRVLHRRTVRRALSEQSHLELDSTMMLPVRYSMGFMLGGKRGSFYGPQTQRAFGHLGFTNVVAYADPERDISVALMNNGKPFITPRQLRWIRIMRVIAGQIPKVHRR